MAEGSRAEWASRDYRAPVLRGMNKENMWETALHALISWAFTLMLKDYETSNKLRGNPSLTKKKKFFWQWIVHLHIMPFVRDEAKNVTENSKRGSITVREQLIVSLNGCTGASCALWDYNSLQDLTINVKVKPSSVFYFHACSLFSLLLLGQDVDQHIFYVNNAWIHVCIIVCACWGVRVCVCIRMRTRII